MFEPKGEGSIALPPPPAFRPAIIEERHALWWQRNVEPIEADLHPLARRVLLCLLDHVCNNEGVCWPGPTRLAQLCSCNSGSVYRSTNELAGLGLISIDLDPDKVMYPRVRRLYVISRYQDSWIGTRAVRHEWCNVAAADFRATRTLGTPNSELTLPQTKLEPAVPAAWGIVPPIPTEPPAPPAQDSFGRREAARLAAKEKALIEDCRRPSKNGVRLRPNQAADLLVTARTVVAEDSLVDVIRKTSFIYNSQDIRRSAFCWWLKALRQHRDYRRGPDEAALAEREDRAAAATRLRVRASGDDPPPTRSELAELWQQYMDIGDMRRAVAVQAVVNGDLASTPNLVAMVRRLRVGHSEAAP